MGIHFSLSQYRSIADFYRTCSTKSMFVNYIKTHFSTRKYLESTSLYWRLVYRMRKLGLISNKDIEKINENERHAIYIDHQNQAIINDWFAQILKKMKPREKFIEAQKYVSLLPVKKLAALFKFSRSGYYKFLKNKELPKYQVKHKEIIIEAFNRNRQVYGRKRLAVYINKKYHLNLNERTVGRRMNKLGLFTLVRRKYKVREIKNTNCIKRNLIKRDYNDRFNRNIYSTDVSYLDSTMEFASSQNHLFLSVVIHHKTKRIIDFSLSHKNDVELVMKNVKEVVKDAKNKPFIIHSDHGYQYTSHEYQEFVSKNNGVISLSRIGNSLDNREVEYFFSIIKSECLNHLEIKKMTIYELGKIIANFISWYNNTRIQSNLYWLSPNSYLKKVVSKGL